MLIWILIRLGGKFNVRNSPDLVNSLRMPLWPLFAPSNITNTRPLHATTPALPSAPLREPPVPTPSTKASQEPETLVEFTFLDTLFKCLVGTLTLEFLLFLFLFMVGSPKRVSQGFSDQICKIHLKFTFRVKLQLR